MSVWRAETCPQAMSLLAQCKRDPEDDAPRLILADWLSEHDDLRGELMRIQVQRAHVPQGSPQWGALLRRERQLVGEHLPAWLGPLVAMSGHWEFRRGLLWLVGDWYSPLWYRLELWTWVEGLQIRGISLGGVSWLAQYPGLAALACLDLSACNVCDEGAQVLAETPHLIGLAHLDLENNLLGDAAAAALARSPQLAWLTRLNLCNNQIGPAGAQALVDSPHLPRTLALDLRGNRLRRNARRQLVQRFGEGVQV
jgi:uncharacterized protein (TIGR02996 family)